jgi:hypothetical protein
MSNIQKLKGNVKFRENPDKVKGKKTFRTLKNYNLY